MAQIDVIWLFRDAWYESMHTVNSGTLLFDINGLYNFPLNKISEEHYTETMSNNSLLLFFFIEKNWCAFIKKIYKKCPSADLVKCPMLHVYDDRFSFVLFFLCMPYLAGVRTVCFLLYISVCCCKMVLLRYNTWLKSIIYRGLQINDFTLQWFKVASKLMISQFSDLRWPPN